MEGKERAGADLFMQEGVNERPFQDRTLHSVTSSRRWSDNASKHAKSVTSQGQVSVFYSHATSTANNSEEEFLREG